MQAKPKDKHKPASVQSQSHGQSAASSPRVDAAGQAAATHAAADLQDTEVRKLDGRSDRLRANLQRDISAIIDKLGEKHVSLNFYDEEHYIGTGENFKQRRSSL